jgi:hypothetical protein
MSAKRYMKRAKRSKMKPEKRFNILDGFEYNLLNDNDFGEDSVREEMILPILKGLGYSANKPYRIIRSKKILHPYVSIGSLRKKIYLIPDYLFEVNNKYAWILEAKAPNEKILNSKHVEQAYSYAINSEIRVQYFSLCNGKEFVLYNVSEPEPLLHFDMRLIPSYWDELLKLLSPLNVLNYDYKLKKDFGSHLERLGFHEYKSMIFPNVPISFIAKINNDLFTFGSGFNFNGADYVASFDFNLEIMHQLKGKIPDKAYNILIKPVEKSITKVKFVDMLYRVNIDCKIGKELAENKNEIFLPLWINKILE